MTPKWTQHEAKKRLWTQIGAIVTSLSTQHDLEVGSRNLESAARDLTLLPWKLKAGSKPSKKVFQLPQEPQKQAWDTNKFQKTN